MRIYEIVTEDTRPTLGETTTHDRWRLACKTFDEALQSAQDKIKGKKLRIQSIEIVADTQL